MTKTEDEKHRMIIKEVNELAIKIKEQIIKKEELLKKLNYITSTLPKIEEEERIKQELYQKMGRKYLGKVEELKKEQKEISKKVKQIEKGIDESKKELLNKFLQKPPPYPLLDIETPTINGNQVVFPIKEEYRLSKLVYEILLSQTWNTTQLTLDDIKFEETRWMVYSKEVLDAIKKVNQILDYLQNSINDVLNIDDICNKRIHESKSWGPALRLLYEINKAASPKEIADHLQWEVKYASATLTNLMKKELWSVPLVERPSPGKYQLNGHGYIIMRKHEQLFGIAGKRKEQPAEKLELDRKRIKLENFMKN